MTAKNDGGPAFPVCETEWNRFSKGMSLRAWLAGQALAGLLALEDMAEDYNQLAWRAVSIADALIAELKKGE